MAAGRNPLGQAVRPAVEGSNARGGHTYGHTSGSATDRVEASRRFGVEPKVKWAPSRNYASLYVDGQNIGYVFRQTRKGMRIEPAASKADLPKGTKGFRPGTRSERFALVGQVATEAEAVAAATVLKAADEKRAAARAEK
jgi:hypothetical protein